MPWNDGLEQGAPAYEIASSNNQRIRVVAGPGTGKSFAMKRRVARLLENGVAPTALLPVTFTRIAAEDLHRELVGMDTPGSDGLKAVTLHSISLRCLMRNHVLQATGRIPRTLSNFELQPMICDLMRNGRGKREIARLQKAYEAAWARLQTDTPGYAPSAEEIEFQTELIAWLRFHRSMLIGEVIPIFHQYLRQNPAAAERTEFSHILVDEYQDLNKAEQSVIDLLSGNAEVCIVGDDDQSIYSFKHAHPDGIRTWLNDNHGAADLTLSECRRCPTRVVELANSLILHNQNRPVPRQLQPIAGNGVGEVQIFQFTTLEQEVAGIADLITGLLANGASPGDILLLAQSKAIGTPLYEQLVQQGVPTKSYYSEAEIASQDAQEAFALLRLLSNRDDRVSLRWLIGLHSPNFYSAGYRRIRQYCEENGDSPWEVLEKLDRKDISIPHTANIVSAFLALRERLNQLEAVEGLPRIVDVLFPDGLETTREIRTLALGLLEDDPEISIDAFASEISQLISQPEIPTEVSDVRIMSLHKSKGLSAPITIICGCVQGLLPRAPDAGMTAAEQMNHLEEQRRLFYVGITRVKSVPAQDKPGILILSSFRYMPNGDALRVGITPAHSQNGVATMHASQFLQELGPTAPAPQAR